jgi:Holliday junction resolvase RusA-like endonuclease
MKRNEGLEGLSSCEAKMTQNQGTPTYTGDVLVRNAALQAALDEPLPDFALIKRMVEQAYTTETGQAVTDVRDVASWIRRAIRENPNFRGLISKTPIPRYVMYPDVAAKFEFLMQRPCALCLPYQRVNFIRFILHTPPVSRQVDRSAAYKSAIQAYLDRAKHDFADFFTARLCVAVTFAFGATARSSDMDNLAKVLLDALQGYAYKNDEQIDHLDLVRTITGNADSFMGVRLAVTRISDNSDTVRPEFDVQWIPTAGIGPIDLTPYL